MNNKVTAAALRASADAVEHLDAEHVKVLGYYCNGRKPVLLIDHPPAFARGAMTRRQPSPLGGVDHVYATPFHGCQIEWLVHTPAVREVGHA